MFIGRLCGWLLVAVAMLMASADAVMALGPVDYAGIAAGDVWTLIAGRSPEPIPAQTLMHLPAWMLLGPMGAGLILACRRRPQRKFRSKFS
jgi:hypothetical protein